MSQAQLTNLTDRLVELKRLLWDAALLQASLIKALPQRLLFRLLMAMEQMNRRHSLHGDHPFFDAANFPWMERLSARTSEIQAELAALLLEVERLPNFQDILPDQTVLTTDARWKAFFFSAYGADFSKNRARCPRTAEALRLIPGMTTAFFSILAPGKVLPAHRGVYNGVLRYHLGLQIPASDRSCAIRVNGITRSWSEGQPLVFDDSYQHDAWNLTKQWRIVLFVDFLRPLPALASFLNRAMVAIIRRTSFIELAVKNHAQWETTFYE
jgi:aspartyl/asparaginyl beta-hydroxylase (cupin superfamily)